MRFWPYKEYSVHIKRPAADVLRQLSLNTMPGEPEMSRRAFRNKDKHFVGQVRQDSFAVMPILRWKGSFIPVFKGTVTEREGETDVHILMQLNENVKAFIIVWMILCMCMLALVLSVTWGKPFNFGMLAPLILCAFGYGISHFGLWQRADESRYMLDKALGNMSF
jgi:hypothetical protein